MKSNIVTAIATLSLAGFLTAGAWTSPNASAPAGNVAAPINVGSDSQTKLGSLILNADTNSPDMYGLDVFGDSRFFGEVVSDTDVCIKNDAETICLSDLASLTIINEGADYSCSLYYDSMLDIGVSRRSGWETPNASLPDTCFSDAGCTIKQEIFNKGGLYSVRHFGFYQDKDSGRWTTTKRVGALTNGDRTQSYVITNFGGKAGMLLVADDVASANNIGINAGTKYTEMEQDRFSFYDSHGAYGNKIYFCSGGNGSVMQ